MAGGRGRGWRGQVPDEEVHHQDRSVQDVMIEDLQRQVAELTRRLAVQEIDDREEEGLASESSLENPYHHPYHHQSYHPHPFHREYRGREESQWSLSFWVDLPEFAGTLHAEDFIDWLDEVEEIFEYNEVPDHVKVKLVSLKLKGRASAWWEHLKRLRKIQGKAKIIEWEKMKKKMMGYFLPFRYTQSPLRRRHSLRKSVKCNEPRQRATNCKKASNFRGRVLLIEENTEEVFEETSDPIYDVEDRDVLYEDSTNGQVLSLLQSSYVSSFDAQFQEDPVLENSPLSQLMLEIGEPVYDVYEDEKDGDVLFEDDHKKVCNMIFDSRSYENAVFNEVVQKLQLNIDYHPKSYKLLWINENQEVCIEDPYQAIICFPENSNNMHIDPTSFFVDSKEIEFNSDVGALYEPFHGGANQVILKMLIEIGRIINTLDFIDGENIRKRKMSNFGEQVYKNYHHRAQIIRKLAIHESNTKYKVHIVIQHRQDPDEATMNSRTSSFEPGVTDAGGFESYDAKIADQYKDGKIF